MVTDGADDSPGRASQCTSMLDHPCGVGESLACVSWAEVPERECTHSVCGCGVLGTFLRGVLEMGCGRALAEREWLHGGRPEGDRGTAARRSRAAAPGALLPENARQGGRARTAAERETACQPLGMRTFSTRCSLPEYSRLPWYLNYAPLYFLHMRGIVEVRKIVGLLHGFAQAGRVTG